MHEMLALQKRQLIGRRTAPLPGKICCHQMTDIQPAGKSSLMQKSAPTHLLADAACSRLPAGTAGPLATSICQMRLKRVLQPEGWLHSSLNTTHSLR